MYLGFFFLYILFNNVVIIAMALFFLFEKGLHGCEGEFYKTELPEIRN